jgi:pimeloyl-ACP methyl ester carboxylesterase
LAVQLLRWTLPKSLVHKGLSTAYADPGLLTDASVTRYHDLLLAPGVRGALIERMQQLVLQDPTPWLARIRAPTLLLWGEGDKLIPPSNAQDYLRVMPHARLALLPGVGHVPHEEAPARTLPALLDFLSVTPSR